MNPRIRHRRTLDTLNDEDLMTELQGGTDEALDILQRRHGTRIFHYLLKFTRNVQTAEDLMQETFLRVYRSRQTYRRIARFTTWLFTIAGNLARSEYRRKQRVTIFSMNAARKPDGAEWELPDETDIPDERVDRAMETERVFHAIDHLPEHFRDLVMMRGLQELSYEEMHLLTGVPLGTIKSRIHRGRTLLTKMLAE